MKSTHRTSVREVSPGTFRVSGVRARSAITGRFVTKAAAAKDQRSAGTQDRTRPATSSNR